MNHTKQNQLRIGEMTRFKLAEHPENRTKGRFLVTNIDNLLIYHAWPLIIGKNQIDFQDFVREKQIPEKSILGGGCSRYEVQRNKKHEVVSARMYLFGMSGGYGATPREIIEPFRDRILEAYQKANPLITKLSLDLNWRPQIPIAQWMKDKGLI